MPPVTEVKLHAKELGVLAVSAMLGLTSLQVLAEDDVVTTGEGLTTTVMAVGVLVQVPTEEIAVTL